MYCNCINKYKSSTVYVIYTSIFVIQQSSINTLHVILLAWSLFFLKWPQNTQHYTNLNVFCFCSGATNTLRLFQDKSDPYLFRWNFDSPVKSWKMLIVEENWKCETVHAISLCVFIFFYGPVVTESKGELDSVMRTVCDPTTFAQVSIETGIWWYFRGHGGLFDY